MMILHLFQNIRLIFCYQYRKFPRSFPHLSFKCQMIKRDKAMLCVFYSYVAFSLGRLGSGDRFAILKMHKNRGKLHFQTNLPENNPTSQKYIHKQLQNQHILEIPTPLSRVSQTRLLLGCPSKFCPNGLLPVIQIGMEGKGQVFRSTHIQTITINTTNIYLPVNRWATSSSILLLFYWKQRDLAASGPEDSTEKLPGKKILPTDLQIRAGLLSPFRLIPTTDWLYFHRQVCKESWTVWQLGQDTKTPSSPAARMDLWDPWPHPTRPQATGQRLCCNQCSLTQWSLEART